MIGIPLEHVEFHGGVGLVIRFTVVVAGKRQIYSVIPTCIQLQSTHLLVHCLLRSPCSLPLDPTRGMLEQELCVLPSLASLVENSD
jgi:hypothetical protein